MAVADMLANTVAQKPDKDAVIAADGRVTFTELDQGASRIAAQLHRAGIGRGDKVAMLLGNDQACRFTATYFGIHKLGAVPVPLNIRWAPPEKHYVLEHSDALAVIAGAEHAKPFAGLSQGEHADIQGRPAEIKAKVFLVHGDQAIGGFRPLGNIFKEGPSDHPPLEPSPTADEPADLLYTSGTTGMPKGVLVPEGNLDTGAGSGQLSQLLGSLFGESLLHAVPLFGFTGCHGLMLMSARSGITQIALPKFDPEALLGAIEKYRATSLMAVPTMLNLAMKHPKLHDYDYSSLKFVFFGAAPIQPDTVKKMMEVWPRAMMLNAYGLTEGGQNAACALGPNPRDIINHPGSVGRPVGCEVFIVDDEDRPLPQGEVGEICFRSEATRRSYYKDSDKTQELWRDQLLHTGDVGYVDEDGYVYITDRKKDMINRGGYNIFANEVERVLVAMPEVLEAAVIGVDHPDLGEDLLAVVVPRPQARPGEGNLTAERINEICRQELADYKSPRHVVFVDELPKNAMSKIVKAELRARFKNHIIDQKERAG